MNADVVYVSETRIERVAGAAPATVPSEARKGPVLFSVHSEVAARYGVDANPHTSQSITGQCHILYGSRHATQLACRSP
jgi:hypothetical protein